MAGAGKRAGPGRPGWSAARKQVSLPADLAEAIAAYQRRHKLPVEADAIRALLRLGVETWQGRLIAGKAGQEAKR